MNKDAEGHTLVSVVIRTYKRAKYLEKCINSLNKQIYPGFEIVVVDRPSNNGT